MAIWEEENALLKISSHKLWLGLWAYWIPGAFNASGTTEVHKPLRGEDMQISKQEKHTHKEYMSPEKGMNQWKI